MSRHQTIGFLSPFLGGYYFGGVLNGVQRVAQQHGFRLIAIQRSLEILGAPQDIRLHSLASDQVDGWIVVLNTAGIQEIARQGMPIVTISALIPGLACPAVFPDNRGGTYAAVRHLLDHGHERIAFVGYMENDDIRQRYAGYQAALVERGLPVDQRLVFPTTDALELGGRAVAQRMLEAGLPCTAVVAGTDLNALGVMEVMREAGYRVPEDLAFAGFDDIEAAQYVTPPLTTVCQRFDAIGNQAAELLLAQLAGQEVPAEITYVPTDLIIRRSCGCRGVREGSIAAHADVCRDSEWGEQLVSELVRLVYPALPTLAVPSAQLWPGAAALVHGLAAAVKGLESPAPRFDEAWQSAVALTSDIEALLAILKLLERAGAQLLARVPNDGQARERVELFLDQAHLEMMRAYHARERARLKQFEEMVRVNYDLSMTLLSRLGNAQKLAWLSHTRASYGCLGLWTNASNGASDRIVIADVYNRSGDMGSLVGSVYMAPSFPPSEMYASAPLHGQDIVALLPILTANRDWGVLAVCGPIEDHLSSGLDSNGVWAALIGAALDHNALLESLAEQQDSLQIAYERERALANTVREIGCPVIPLLPGVLLVPLVGAIDTERARQIIEAVLGGVCGQHATDVLLDITGVPLVDTQVANSLIATARAATLLGARVVLVGIRPEIAQSIIGLGIDLRQITTQPSLAAALSTLQRQRR